jgi:hypothetical protein
MSIRTKLRLGGKWVAVTALLDSGAEINMINPRILGPIELNQLQYHVPVSGLFSASTKTLGSCHLWNRTTDDYTVTEQRKSMFVVADIGDIDVILGYPWLQSTDPIVQ